MINYGIAIFPSKPIQDEANSYRKRYDPKYALIPPHITLKESFRIDEQEMDGVVTTLKQIANEIEPFTIDIQKVSSFAPVTNTIYFTIEPNQVLNDLYENLHEGVFLNTAQHNDVLHIITRHNLPDSDYSEARAT